MRRMHRTMRGKAIDMEALRDRNGDVVAATPPEGGVRMNARGDLLGPGGQIVKAREEIARDYHASARPEIQRGGMDRLKAMATPVPRPGTQADNQFYRRPTPQSFDDIDFKTPEQIIAEAEAAQRAAMQAEEARFAQAAGGPEEFEVEATPRPAPGRKGKLVQKDN